MSISAWAAYNEDKVLQPFSYTPKPLAPLHIRLRITHCGVCHSDVHSVDGDWSPASKQMRPIVPGHEIVGVVVETGADVDKKQYAIGTRVGVGPLVGSCHSCDQCEKNQPQYCFGMIEAYQSIHPDTGERTFGGFASGVTVDSRYAFVLPPSLPSPAAAPLLCAGITVWSPLKRYAHEGCTVGVVGIGGLGHIALQFANKMGLDVVAFTTSADKADQARAFGAQTVVNSKDANEMKGARLSLDLLLVTSSADLPWSQYLMLLRTGGRLCLVGVPPGTIAIKPGHLLRNVSICGSLLGSPQETAEMLAFAAQHNVRPMIEELPMHECNKAMDRVRANLPRYRCVLHNPEPKL